jgi:AcrR family transcriptional regulator
MVYKAFRNKPGLVRALWDQALEGVGPSPAQTRSDAVLERADDPREIIRSWALLSAEVGALAAPVLALVRTAAGLDPEAAELHREIEQGRARRMLHNARLLRRAGHLRPELSVTQAAQVMLAFTGWLYEPLRIDSGWSEREFVDLMERTLAAALLP